MNASRKILQALAFAATAAHGMTGELDPTYGSAGIASVGDRISPTIAVDDVGRAYLLGAETWFCGNGNCGYVTRITAAGTLDTAFGMGGRVDLYRPGTVSLENMHLRRLPSGKMLYFYLGFHDGCSACTYTYGVRRLNPDGTDDPTFIAPSLTHPARTNPNPEPLLEIYSDGRFLFGTSHQLRRYLADGTPDPAFPPFNAGHWMRAATYADGSAIVIGRLTGTSRWHFPMYRLAANGTRDMTFGGGTGEVLVVAPDGTAGNMTVHDIATLPDGKILLALHTRKATFSVQYVEVRRYLASGQLDSSFGTGGIATISSTVTTAGGGETLTTRYDVRIEPQGDGKVVVAGTDGSAGLRRIFVARLDADGAGDPTFAGDGLSFIDASSGQDVASALFVHPLGIYLGGGVGGTLWVHGMLDPFSTSPAVMRVQAQSGPVAIQPEILLPGGMGVPYQYRLSASDGTAPYAFSLVAGALPPGVQLVGDTLQGIPNTPRRSRFHIRARDALGGEQTHFYSLDIHDVGSLVQDYYGAILSHPVDAYGQAFWQREADRVVAMGADKHDVVHALSLSFFGSAEYEALQLSDAEFVRQLYQTYLGREADTGGNGYWVSQIAAGLPRGAVLNQFLFAPEFDERLARIFGARDSRAEIRMAIDFYRGLLGRLPDTDGFNYWIGRLRAAQCNGTVAAEADSISRLFISLDEYGARQAAEPQVERTRAYMVDLYNAFLRRGGDLPGFQYWTGQIDASAQTRDQVRRQFIESPEFQARVSAVAAQGCMN